LEHANSVKAARARKRIFFIVLLRNIVAKRLMEFCPLASFLTLTVAGLPLNFTRLPCWDRLNIEKFSK